MGQSSEVQISETSQQKSFPVSAEWWKRAVRVELARRSIKSFCEIYLPHHFYSGFSDHHEDFFQAVERKRRFGKRVVRAMPRESGKSSIATVAVPLHQLAYKLKWYILLFGSSASKVQEHFSTMQKELDPAQGNEMILNDFPHLRPAMDFKGQLIKWTDSRIKMASGATVDALSIHSKLRGLKSGRHRPDLIILDDPQDDEEVATYFRRQRVLRKFRSTIMALGGSECDIFVEGNLMHAESLISELLRDKNWDRKLWMAQNIPRNIEDENIPIGNKKQDGSPLWPEQWPADRLEARRIDIKDHAFALEYNNLLRADEESIFDSSNFLKFDRLEFDLDDSYQVVAAWDPADPKRSDARTDFAAISVTATKKVSGIRYYWILEAWLKRVGPEEQCEKALDFHEKYPLIWMTYEDNGGFGVIMPTLRRKAKDRGIKLRIRRRTQTKNKIQRILSVEVVVKDRVFFEKRLSPVYFSQWTEFPGTHDDGPDSTVTTIEPFEKGGLHGFGG